LATYKQLLADKTINEQQYNTASNQLQLQWAQKRREVLLAQRTSEQTEMQAWLANLKSNMTSSTGLMTETFNSFTTNIASGLTNAIIQADSFGDAMRNAAASFAQSMIQAIIQVMAQKAAMWALEQMLGSATSSGYATQVAGQAAAGVNLAAINAYSSTAAIPIVGPAAAPAAAAAATAATTPFATAAVASAASSISGMAHDGISSVPSEGTWLLNKGERVYTNDSAKQLDQMYKNSQQSSGGNVTVNVSLQETSDTSQQGTTQQSTNDDGSIQVNVFVADIRSEGSMAQVLERTYGLSRMGA
jgi:predicted RNA-binding Zn ribbon-like protein